MVDIVGSASPNFSQFQNNCVAQSPEAREWAGAFYSADNRRLFMAKLIAPLIGLESISEHVIKRTQEFQAKLEQEPRPGNTWATNETEVQHRIALGDAARQPCHSSTVILRKVHVCL
jgi:hypothetical protein